MQPIMRIVLGERLARDQNWASIIKVLYSFGVLDRVGMSREDECALEVYLGVIPYYGENALIIIEQWLDYVRTLGARNVPPPRLCNRRQETSSINRSIRSRT
ncbi:MAG: hypothetical protein GSR81_00800 [Desulfurococcales archaeon]|nr:hypothetical protein [Desulfurococcales archaeon]